MQIGPCCCLSTNSGDLFVSLSLAPSAAPFGGFGQKLSAFVLPDEVGGDLLLLFG